MVEKVFASGYLSIKVHTDSSIALSATQVTKNSPPQAEKGWVCCRACGLIFSYFKK
jgi:hypothetical protein